MNIFNKSINLSLIILLILLIIYILYDDYNLMETLGNCSVGVKLKQSGSKKSLHKAVNKIQSSITNSKQSNGCLNLDKDSTNQYITKLTE